MANVRKLKTIGIFSLVILLLLIVSATHFLVLPFVFNRIEKDENQIFIQLENNILDLDSLISLKTKTLSNQDYLAKISQGENLMRSRTELLNKLESHQSNWSKLFLPPKYKEYENKKTEALRYLKNTDLELNKIKNIEYSVQRLIVSLDTYDKKVTYSESDKDWDVYINEATEATREGELLAKQSSEFLKQGLITKDINDYIQQTVLIKNEFLLNFYDPQYLTDKNFIMDKMKASVEKLKKRPDISSAMVVWRDQIITPLSKIKGEYYTSFLEKKSDADQYYKNNRLNSDPLSVLLGKIRNSKSEIDSSMETSKVEDIRADLNGDGENETLRIFNTDPTDESLSYLSLIALDKGGKEMGKLPESMAFPKPVTNSGQIYIPFPDKKLQIVSFDFSVGPHSSETIFFVYVDEGKVVLPICLKEGAQEREDCSFWSGETGELIVRDLDNDGLLEVVETVDEYPKDGKISEELIKATDDAFIDLGKVLANGAKRVARREAGGRGRKVVWRIYKLNNNYFEQQLGSNYDKYFELVSAFLWNQYSDSPTLMKRNDMSKDSEDYNLFMRNFWTRRG